MIHSVRNFSAKENVVTKRAQSNLLRFVRFPIRTGGPLRNYEGRAVPSSGTYIDHTLMIIMSRITAQIYRGGSEREISRWRSYNHVSIIIRMCAREFILHLLRILST